MRFIEFIEREPVRFILAGGLNTATTYAAYLMLLQVVGYTIAYSVSYIGGIFFSYYLSARFVFRRPLRWRHAVRYPLVYVLQYGLGVMLTVWLVDGVRIDAEFAPALVIVTTLPFTFLISRWIIKRSERRGPLVEFRGGTNASLSDE